MEIRTIIIAAMEGRGLSANKLATLAGYQKNRIVYDFVKEPNPAKKIKPSTINSDALGKILDALGLSIISTREVEYLRETVIRREGEIKTKESEIGRLQTMIPTIKTPEERDLIARLTRIRIRAAYDGKPDIPPT